MLASASAERKEAGGVTVLRTWLALHRQKRRRQGGGQEAPPAPVPVIVDGYYEWDTTEHGWADVTISWTIDYNGFPEASFEVWMEGAGQPDHLVATVQGSDRQFFQACVTSGEDTLNYRVRYRNGEVIGGFSNVYVIGVQL